MNNLPSFSPCLWCLESSTDGKINENHGLKLLNKCEVCHKHIELNHPLKSGQIVVNCFVNEERLRDVLNKQNYRELKSMHQFFKTLSVPLFSVLIEEFLVVYSYNCNDFALYSFEIQRKKTRINWKVSMMLLRIQCSER